MMKGWLPLAWMPDRYFGDTTPRSREAGGALAMPKRENRTSRSRYG